jgi:hypothetical protein
VNPGSRWGQALGYTGLRYPFEFNRIDDEKLATRFNITYEVPHTW